MVSRVPATNGTECPTCSAMRRGSVGERSIFVGTIPQGCRAPMPETHKWHNARSLKLKVSGNIPASAMTTEIQKYLCDAVAVTGQNETLFIGIYKVGDGIDFVPGRGEIKHGSPRLHWTVNFIKSEIAAAFDAPQVQLVGPAEGRHRTQHSWSAHTSPSLVSVRTHCESFESVIGHKDSGLNRLESL